MNDHEKPVELEQIACDICMKEVPISEATVAEATDYVVHFCGLDCYQKWRSQSAPSEDSAGQPAPKP